MSELKTCPFCRSDRVAGCYKDGFYQFVCINCGAVVHFATEDEQEATEKWNRRADGAECDKLKQENAELKKRVDDLTRQLNKKTDDERNRTIEQKIEQLRRFGQIASSE